MAQVSGYWLLATG